MATGDSVRIGIEKYCKSRLIRTETQQVAETTNHDQRKLWRMGLQLVNGTLESVHGGLGFELLGDLELYWLCTLGARL